MMENDRVFELLKQGRFNIMRDNIKHEIYKVYWDGDGDLMLQTTYENYLLARDCSEIVPWVDKYKDVIENWAEQWDKKQDYSVFDCINKAVSEIETLHKGENNE